MRALMNNCIHNLMEEHRLIVAVLGSLDVLAEKLDAGGTVSSDEVLKFTRFFVGFADKAHHGKEEDRLFLKMQEAGFPRESGPLAVMLHEHGDGRSLVRAMAESAANPGPLAAAQARNIVGLAREFIVLLRLHIHKEDNILYPMACQCLPEAEMRQLDEACGQFDREMIGPEERQRLKDLAAELMRSYPAAPDRLEELVAQMGCGGGGCGH